MIKEKTNPIHWPRVSTPLFGCNIAWVQLGLWSVFGFQRRQHWCFELEYFCRGKLSCALYVGWLSPLLASLCSIPVDLLRCDNQKCLQTLPNAPPPHPCRRMWAGRESPLLGAIDVRVQEFPKQSGEEGRLSRPLIPSPCLSNFPQVLK